MGPTFSEDVIEDGTGGVAGRMAVAGHRHAPGGDGARAGLHLERMHVAAELLKGELDACC
jgi:hypothetical protein